MKEAPIPGIVIRPGLLCTAPKSHGCSLNVCVFCLRWGARQGGVQDNLVLLVTGSLYICAATGIQTPQLPVAPLGPPSGPLSGEYAAEPIAMARMCF